MLHKTHFDILLASIDTPSSMATGVLGERVNVDI